MTDTRRIQLLSDEVANKIAAGEVVDRPASVVKELIENALDAGAGRITVEIVSGGRKAIVVSDDGCGMGRDDALLSVERHATSKIRDVHDIERVRTMGFRGEALAAVSAVSRFRLTTREKDALSGTEIVIVGGKVNDVRDAGCPPGTAVEVRNLFFNIPARRKFLRSEQTELSHVRQTFLTYAFACPDAALTLTVDGRDTYRLAGGMTLAERLRDLLDPASFKALRPVDYADDRIRVTGYVGTPDVNRSDRSGQYIFINKRPASAPLLGYGLREAYEAALPRDRHPLVFLFIEIAPELIDVNVHPTKKEVRFRRPVETRDGLMAAVMSALASPAGGASTAMAASSPVAAASQAEKARMTIEGIPAARTFQYPRLPLTSEPEPARPAGETAAPKGEPPIHGRSPWTWCRVMGLVGGRYVVLETEEGMVLMDPHAAHERVLYERMLAEADSGHVPGQGLLTPENVELGPAEALCVRQNLELLRDLGFGLSEFGGDTFLVDALPASLGAVSAAAVLLDTARDVDQGSARGASRRWTREQVVRSACHAAVRLRDRLTLDEIERLVVDLARTEMPYTCPHGRPTLIFMGYRELDRKFGRV